MALNGKVQTLEDAKAFAKTLLDEGANTFWSDTQQTVLANEANRIVFRELVDHNPEFFLEKTGPITIASGTESAQLDASGILGAGVNKVPYKIVGIEEVSTSAAISDSNLPVKWRTMRFSDRYQVQRLNAGYYGEMTRHYCVVKNLLYMAPIPTSDIYVYIYWIAPLADITSGSSKLLSQDGSLTFVGEQFGDCVGYCLAHLMNSKQNNANPAVEQLWAESLTRLQNHSQLRNVDEPMSVRITRGPWE